jgi:hypothetical protein
MIPFQVTREDLLRGKTITPGWYVLLITNVTKGEAATDGSMTVKVEHKVSQDGPYKDVPVNRTFSEKAPGFAISFIESVMHKKIDTDKGGTFDLSQSVGRKVWGYVNNEMFGGRLVNRVADYKAYEEGQMAPSVTPA